MKTRLISVSVSLLVGSAWWTGCSSDSSSSGGPTPLPDSGATADTGTPPTDGGGDSSPVDAAKDTGVDAALTGLPYLPIMYGAANCPAFEPCGGDVKGSWKLTGGCVTEALFAQAKQQCPAIVESNVVIQARGTVVADAVTIARHTDVKLSATLAVPAACKPGGYTCAQIGGALTSVAGLKSAACTDDAGGCKCDVTNALDEITSDAYTTSGSTLTTGAGSSARTFDYCVKTTELAYKETTSGSAIPAIFVNSK